MQSKEWQQKFADQVGTGIENARGKRSDQWIADRTKELGHAISRTAISEYRRGIRKSMPVTDLMVIAQALKVPPVTLLFPNLPNGEVVLVPSTLRPTALDSLRWFTGEASIPARFKRFVTLDSDGNIQEGPPVTMYSGIGGLRGDGPSSTPAKILKASRDLAEAWNTLREAFLALTDPSHPSSSLPDEMKNSQYNNAVSRVDELSKIIESLDGDMTDWEAQPTKGSHGNG